MMDAQLAGFIALALFLGLTVHLTTGEIRLYQAPPSWHHVNRADDPGKFWAFVSAEGILFIAVTAQGILRLS